MNQCAGLKTASAEEEMEKLYEEQMSYLRSSSPHRELLLESQQAWLKYRNAACSYVVGPEESRGTLLGYLWASCSRELIRSRANTLRGYVACRENGCPW